MKVQISLADELIYRVDNYAEDNYMSRSGVISFALVQFLKQYDDVLSVVVKEEKAKSKD